MKKIGASFVLKVAVSVALIAYLFTRLDAATLLADARNIDWRFFFVAYLLGLLDRCTMAFKWRWLTAPCGFSLSLKEALINTYMGNFAGEFLPAGIGGDVVRVALLKKIGVPVVRGTASIAMERILGLLALMTAAETAYVVAWTAGYPAPQKLGVIVTLAFLGFAAAFFLSFHPAIDRVVERLMPKRKAAQLVAKLRELRTCYQNFSHHKLMLLKFFLASMAEVLIVIMVYWVMCRALGVYPRLLQLLLVIPMVLLVLRIPVSVNGLGLQEGILGFYFLSIGQTLESALLLSLLLRLLNVLITAPGGLLFLRPAAPRSSELWIYSAR